jgi:hypothetical protein
VSARRRAFRAWLVAAPFYVLTAAAPAGGLFRGRAYVDLELYHRYAQGFLDGMIPYRDTFVEYPPGAFVVLLPPALVTEGHYRFLFKLLMAAIALGGLWCVARLLVELGAGTRRLALALGFVAVSPLLLGSVWLNSYDAWPAALTAGSLLALALGAAAPAFLLLGLAAAAKVYAVFLVVPAALYARARLGMRAVVEGVAAFVVTIAVVIGPFVALSPGGVWSSFRSQLERGLHVESLGASVLLALDRLGLYDATVSGGSTAAKSRDLAGPLPDALATVSSLVLLAAVVAAWLLFARRTGELQRLATAFAACVAAVLGSSKILSPQYAEWLVFLVPLTAGAPGVAATLLAAAALLLAEAWFHHYASIYAVGDRVWLLLLRNLAFAACYAVLVWALVASPRSRRDTV